MKAHVMHIGVVDKNDRVHAVTFEPGVNVVTGRSSTGKSALIEIFDFCFGSSEFTVPVGVITEQAWLYFTVMQLGAAALVLGRQANSARAFFKEELDVARVARASVLTKSYFEQDYFQPHDRFLKQLTRHFGVVVTDIDEDLAVREWRRRKAPSPSARSFTSYMLQHQNLVANKHAIFYRFDERAKREQAIDHLKIFLGFANQEYFLKKQELNELEQQARAMQRMLPKRQEARDAARRVLVSAIAEYEAIAGTSLGVDVDTAMSNPARMLKEVEGKQVSLVTDSNGHVQHRQAIDMERSAAISQLRRMQQELAAVQSSIDFSTRYAERNRDTVVPEHAELHAAACPFCSTPNHVVENSANELTVAIKWLNSELSRSSFRVASFEETKAKLEREIAPIRTRIAALSAELKRADDQLAMLGKQKSLYELSVAAKLRVEQALADLEKVVSGKDDDDLIALRERIRLLLADLKERFDIDRKLEDAQARIDSILATFGNRFDFEESYRPIRLRFSVETFDLWHEPKEKKQVFLRSMGSGANWLSCHLALFLALHRYFCELGNACAIPAILFVDQPSQVYFPSLLDGEDEFRPEELARRDTSRAANRVVDEDVRAVTNLFDQLVWYCEDTFQETGIRPQIIVTDHADHLDLTGDVIFESLVRKRWRREGEGFISPPTEMLGN